MHGMFCTYVDDVALKYCGFTKGSGLVNLWFHGVCPGVSGLDKSTFMDKRVQLADSCPLDNALPDSRHAKEFNPR